MIFGALYLPFAMKLQYMPMGDLLNSLILTVLPMAVCAGFWIWKGATPGKMLTGLKVVRADTLEPLGWGRALGRYLAYNLSFFTCGFGFFWAGWDGRKQALHDHVASTAVVHVADADRPGVKTLLASAAVAAALLLAGGFMTAGWLSRSRDRFQAEGKVVEEEARSFGKAHNQLETVQEALRRLDACGGLFCETTVRMFLREALEVASPSAGFCSGVPPKESMLAGALWCNESCVKFAHATPPCGRMMQEVMQYCVRAPGAAAPEPVSP